MSPWVALVEKSVRFAPGEAPQIYHCLTQADYVGVLALTGMDLCRSFVEFRPCVEDFTWEFPAGTVRRRDSGNAARRELREEGGLRAEQLVYFGCFHPDTGRLQVRSHAFFARASRPARIRCSRPNAARNETGYPPGAAQDDASDGVRHQLHWAIYAAAMLRGVCQDLTL